MNVYGILMVRNAADIIRLNVQYHRPLGVDHFLIVDNGSSDGTDRILQQLSQDKRVRWTRNDSPYQQAKIYTELAREAYKSGADWVVPIDGDEFWYARHGNFRKLLAETKAGALRVRRVNFVQRREQRTCSPNALRHMTMRAARPVGPVERCEELVETRRIGLVEAECQPKWISRASATLELAAGNHQVSELEGPCEDTDELVILHAPIRSRAILEAKAEHGRRVIEAGYIPGNSWHLRRFSRLQLEGSLDEEWLANSYLGDSVDVDGSRHQLVFDATLRHALARWVGVPLWERLLSIRR